MTSGLAAQVSTTDPRLLLPGHAASPPERLDLVASVRLPGGAAPLFLALAAEPGGAVHTLPLVDAVSGLRRARAGDGIATAVLRLLAAGESGDQHQVRPGRCAPAVDPGAEVQLGDGEGQEVFAVGHQRVAVHLRPTAGAGGVVDVVGALDRAGFAGMVPWLGDVFLTVGDVAYGPVVLATAPPGDAHSLADRLVGLVAGHLRGGDDPEPTLSVAARLGRALADVQLALGRLELEPPGARVADDEVLASWRREASDAFAEAVVLAEGEPGERLRARASEVRDTLDSLTAAAGSPLVPPLALSGPAAFVVDGDRLLLDPLALDAVVGAWRSPARDVAAVLRGVDRIARSVHHRLVAGGFPAPVERVTSWYEAVRREVLDACRGSLAAAGRPGLLDERILLAFEVEAECRALSRASRYLSTARGIADGALADLLGSG